MDIPLDKYDINATSRRGNLGFNAGVTVGFNIFDGNRRREKRNATLAFKNLAVWNVRNWSLPFAPTLVIYGRLIATTFNY